MSTDAHARPSGDQEELLYDPNVPTPTHGERSRTLVEAVGTGTLSTVSKEPAGFPYGSFVLLALDEGNPVFLFSELAEHTKNLRAESRCSLLVAEDGEGDPLARGRVTLIGHCEGLSSNGELEQARRAYLETHPNASYYVDYKDFSFWKLEVDSLRYIGGYGRMSWVTGDDWFSASPDPIMPHAKAIIDHMNQDHASTMVEYCKAFSKAKDTTAALMTVVDCYGFEMSAQTGRGPRPIRLAFSQPIGTPEDARKELVSLAKQAREVLSRSDLSG
jgi:putative heme iron utilization protein